MILIFFFSLFLYAVTQPVTERFAFQPSRRNAVASRPKSCPFKFELQIPQLPKVDAFMNDRPRFRSMNAFSASQMSINALQSSPSLMARGSGIDFMRTLSMPSVPMRRGSAISNISSISSANTNSYLHYTANSWEYLGTVDELTNLSDADVRRRQCEFSSDTTKALMPIDALHLQSKQPLNTCWIITPQLLIAHIKALVIGIESSTFRFDMHLGRFQLMADVTVDGVQKKTLRHALGEVIECGTCYKRIKMLITRDRELMVDSHDHSYMFIVSNAV